jgi:RNA polymerase sigma-70 factor (ECF subfamily)
MEDRERTDEEIAAAVQGGNLELYGTLMERYESRLARYGRRFLADRDDVAGLVQDIFVKAYRNLKSFDTRQRFSPWLYRIAHNEFVSELRRRGTRPFTLPEFDILLAHAPAEDREEDRREQEELATLLERELARLSPAHREVLVLYYLEGMRYQDIAEVLKIPAGTVAARLSRAKAALRAAAPALKHVYGN